jgi:hypothetical protein
LRQEGRLHQGSYEALMPFILAGVEGASTTAPVFQRKLRGKLLWI